MTRLTAFSKLLIVLLVVGIGVITPIKISLEVKQIEATVLDKERVTKRSGENIKSFYLVYTDVEVFKNEDSVVHMKFNSSDLQGSLSKDSTYTLKVSGRRIPVISMYPNILKIED